MSYSADFDALDEPVREAVAGQKKDDTIRIRLQPSILRRDLNQHRDWRGVSWTIDCRSLAEAVALREALQALFSALVREDPRAVIQLLDDVKPAA